MTLLDTLLLNFFRYNTAVFVKDLLTGLVMFFVGVFLTLIYSSYISSIVRTDEEGFLEKENIKMLILENKHRTRIITRKKREMYDTLSHHYILILHKLKLLKNNRVTSLDVKRAKLVFWLTFIFVFMIAMGAMIMTADVMILPIEDIEELLNKQGLYIEGRPKPLR